MRGRYVGREFLLVDASGPLVRADSEWLLLDLASGRPLRPEQHFPPERIACWEKVFDGAFPALAKAAHPEPVGDFAVRWEDIDANGHVANPHYVAWILECVPGLVGGENELAALSVEFRQAAVHGDTVRVLREGRVGEGFRFSLVRAADGVELVRAMACIGTS
jgi:acyl-ACP thioesterase